MRRTYTYSLLQYHHSIALGEILNIGILLYFPSLSKLSFIHPNNLARPKNLYTNFPEKTILNYYEYFSQRVKELNVNSDIFLRYNLNNDLKELIELEFLQADSSMLQFSNSNKAILYTDDVDELIKKLAHFYFPLDKISVYEKLYSSYQKKNKEDWIKPDLKNKIVKIDKDFIFLPNKNELSF